MGENILWGLWCFDFFEETNYAGYCAIVYRESFSTSEYQDSDSYVHEIWKYGTPKKHYREKFAVD